MTRRLKIVSLIVLITAAALVGRLALGDRFEAAKLISFLQAVGSSPAAIPLFLLIFGAATTFFTPAVALMLTAGVVWGFWPGWLVVWIAANVWSNVHFAIGRFFARESVRAWLDARGAQRIVRELEHGGVLATVIVRQLPLPFLVVNLAAGATPVTWPRWVLGNALGLLPNAIIYTQLASALVSGAEGAKQEAVVRVVVAAAAIVASSLGLRWLQGKMSGPRGKEPS